MRNCKDDLNYTQNYKCKIKFNLKSELEIEIKFFYFNLKFAYWSFAFSNSNLNYLIDFHFVSKYQFRFYLICNIIFFFIDITFYDFNFDFYL